MENKLKRIFEYQSFENNKRLAAIIAETEERYSAAELSDEALFYVSAAGIIKNEEKRDI